MLRFGPETGPVVVVASPLFEEANRTRALLVALCRALAEHGVASALPDLPGQGESLVPLEALSCVGEIGEGYEAAVDTLRERHGRVHGAAIRSGALLDFCAELDSCWHFAPQGGPEMLRELTRIKQAADPSRPLHPLWYQEPLAPDGEPQPPVEVAGNVVAARLFTILKADVIHDGSDPEDVPLRTVRLDTDPRPADRHVPGRPLWRQAEPENDPALAAMLAADIAEWIAACDG